MNVFKTIVFLLTLSIVLIFLGHVIGGHEGVYVGVIIALITLYVALFNADLAMLNLYQAKEILAETHPDTHAIMQALTVKAGIPLPKLYLIDVPAANIFAAGKCPRNGKIVMTSGLLTALSKEEQTALIAQAIANIKLKNSLLNGVAAVVAGSIAGMANIGWEVIIDEKDPHEKPHFNETVMKFLGPIAAFTVKSIISPRMQVNSDALSVTWTDHPEHLISALEKLEALKSQQPFPVADARPATAHFFIINPLHRKKWAHIFRTHAPTDVRIQRLQRTHTKSA